MKKKTLLIIEVIAHWGMVATFYFFFTMFSIAYFRPDKLFCAPINDYGEAHIEFILAIIFLIITSIYLYQKWKKGAY